MKWLLLLTVMGCAQITSLNLQKHQFGVQPTRIIWFQVAGLDAEHVAMLRFNQSGEKRTSFEESICLGQSWAYNLYDLRPSAQASFMSQLTGKKNVKSSCEDASLSPIWSYLSRHGYKTGILEVGGTPVQSLVSLNQCGENGLVFLSSLHLWLRKEAPVGTSTFHYGEEIPVEANKIFYDRSCNARTCASSITDDVKAIYEKFQRASHKHMLIVRDFTYLAALEKKDFVRAREILADLERAYAHALSFTKNSNDSLALLTTADSRLIDMPDQGRAWYEFEKGANNAQTKRARLTNTVAASGARAENFCGTYDDSSIFERILSGPKQQGLELKIINPFK